MTAGMPWLLASVDSGWRSVARYSMRSVNSWRESPSCSPSGMSEMELPRCSLMSPVAIETSLPSAPISCTPVAVDCLRMPSHSSPAFVSTITVP